MTNPDQEPVIGTKTWFENDKVVTQHLTAKDIYKDPEQPEQEPVCAHDVIKNKCEFCHHSQKTWEKPWVSLTDDEISEVLYSKEAVTGFGFARAIEAKLKEKNCG